LLAAGFLASCTASEERRVAWLAREQPAPAAFTVCHGSNCKVRTAVSLDGAQWLRVAAILGTPAPSAAEERGRIGEAVGLIERLVADRAGTGADVGGNLAVRDQASQLDCVDETVNTMAYLKMFAAEGCLRWHRLDQPAHRGLMFDGRSPHNTAVVTELATGGRHAIDSYFRANGVAADSVPIDLWLAGWDPRKPNNGLDTAAAAY
jgi:hypothetical protein